VEIDPRLMRTGEIRDLRADATLARHEMGWKPEVEFSDLVRMMVRADVEALRP
jgi:GDPmannose 4,6-dehydratase